MNIFSTKSVYSISLILTILIFLFCNFLINNFIINNLNSNQIVQESKFSFFNIENKENNKEQINYIAENKEEYDWYIEINSINLKAPIEETTSTEILTRSVGHFEETSLQEGNIGLAAHNRGYKINYFKDLKSVKIGNEIIYKYQNYKNTYIVDKIEIIKDTDWSYLDKTDENKITLITCVENEPKLRRCVQATQENL